MALKGHAKIELIDSNGNVETVEHDNMITKAVDDYFKSYRGELAPIYKVTNNGDSFVQTLFGGIMLFDDVLNDDANDYFFPSINVTGYASQDGYSGLDAARGSYNAIESGIQADGSYKFVWDFATSQANGRIQSIALCPNLMGQIGVSDTVQDSEKKGFQDVKPPTAPFYTNIVGAMIDSNSSIDGVSAYQLNIVAIVGDIAYAIDEYNLKYDSRYPSNYIFNNGGKFVLRRFKLGTNNIGLNDYVGRATFIDRIEITLPTEFTDALCNGITVYNTSFYFDKDNNKLILFPCNFKNDIAVNGTTKYCEIELTNEMVVNVYTYTNTTNGTLNLLTDYSYYETMLYSKFFVLKDYILSMTKSSDGIPHMYVTNKSDNTQVKEVKHSNNSSIIKSGREYPVFTPIYNKGKILVFRTGYVSAGKFNLDDYYIMDLETGIARKTNIASLSIHGQVLRYNDLVWGSGRNSHLRFLLDVNFFVLTTKNNLDSPVTKTASQTMKITYTLKESGV